MINFNASIVGQVIMYVFILLFGIVSLYGAYKFTRPFNEESKSK